jgi:hypothetical protein
LENGMAPPREHARPDRRRKRPSFNPFHEHLEVRVVPARVGLPPIVPTPPVPAGDIAPLETNSPAGGNGSPVGYTPQQIRAAYGFEGITFGSISGDGAGQTIAIVDAYDDPALVASSAANFSNSDLAQFDRQFNLTDPPSFTKLNEAGNTSPLPATDPAGPGSSSGDWEYEEAMDVEWAHALAPAASIVLVEANSNGTGDLYSAINIADHLPGVSVVSLSWGSPEFSGETYWDQNYQTPTGHRGVTFVAAAGDGGAPGLYPAYSPNVVAAGGTTLQLNSDGSIQSESAWSTGGGGISSYETEPAYQKGVQDTGYRTIPDVSFLADRSIGVSVYDSYDNTGGGAWITMGGTSLAAPAWAALIAVADQGRVAFGGTTLDGATQTLPALYSLPSADFHDITSGGNGTFNAGIGYDEATGLGTPVANLLATDLAFYGMADHLAITAQPPSSTIAGQPFGLTVEVESPDGSLVAGASGTVTISLGTNARGGSLGGTLTATIDQGVATFTGLSLDDAGTGYSVSASGSGLGSVMSSPFNVTPAAPAVLVIAAQPPSSVTAGSGFGLTVDVEDAFGNLVTNCGSNITVGLAGGPAGAALGGTLSVPASGGVATFAGLAVDQAGSGYTIEIMSGGLATASTQPFAVAPSAPAQLVITAEPPSTVTAGDGFGLKVSVEDAYGNLETGYGDEVTLALAGGPAGAAVKGTSTEKAAGGVAAFSGLELTKAARGYTIEAASGGLTSAWSRAFDVTPAAPAQLVVSQPPSTLVIAGVHFGLSVSVEDAFGNLVTSADNEIALALSGGAPGASLGGTSTAKAAAGVATFNDLTVSKGGSHYVLEASSAGLDRATTADFSVAPGAPAQLVITLQPPASVTAGNGFGLGVSVEDDFGNLVTGFSGNIAVSLTGGPAGSTVSGQTTVKASRGIASFSGLTIHQAGGNDVLQVAVEGVGSISSSPFRVVPAAASHLAIVDQPPSRLVAGQPFGITVAAEDRFGNPVTGFNNVVSLSLANGPAGSMLSGDASADAVNGIATIAGLALDKAGAGYQLEAASGELASSASTAMTVAPASPSRLVITLQPPGSVTAKQPFEIAIKAEDAYGNVASTFDGTVSAALARKVGRGTLEGTLSVPASDGLAVLTNLAVDRIGKSYAITITSSELTPAITSVFSVTKPAAQAARAKAIRRDLGRRLPSPRALHGLSAKAHDREPMKNAAGRHGASPHDRR